MRPSFASVVLLLVLLIILAAPFLKLNVYFDEFVRKVMEDPNTPRIPYFVFRSVLRMFIAYIFVVIFGLSYGIVAGLYEGPRKVMIPLLDILQSVPVLGYLPAAVLFFTNALPGVIGQEAASILLIFTGMAWAVAFSVYGGVRAIPNDLREVSRAFGVSGWGYVRHFVLPAIFPNFIIGSMLAVGGGWYFLVACEYMTFGSKVIALEGIGYYLADAVYNQNNIPAALFGLAVFVVVVYAINRLVWRPLIYYSKRFNFQTVALERDPAEERAPMLRLIRAFRSVAKRSAVLLDVVQTPLRMLFRNYSPRIRLPGRPRALGFIERITMKHLLLFALLFIAVVMAYGLFVSASLQKPLSDLRSSLAAHPEAQELPIYIFYSLCRIFIAYLIALAWTLPAAIIITRDKRLESLFLPLFDIGQSIPALALFPFIVVIVMQFIGGELGIEVGSILLLLTGSQWYLLFSIIGAIGNVPGDIKEVASAFGYRGLGYVRAVLLPAIFPGLVIGSIQAWGGAWNALIVSEYITYEGCPDGVCMVKGLGSFLDLAVERWGDPGLATLAVALMSLSVIMINNLVWRRLFKLAEKYRFEMT